MESPTKIVITPITQTKLEIKDWITGQEAETIDAVLMKGVEINPDVARKTITSKKFDTSVIAEQTHLEIEKFVVSLNDSKENILQNILNLPEEEYSFVCQEVRNRRKKKITEETNTSGM